MAHNSRSGFTLLEVLIALSIIAIAFTSLFSTQSSSLSLAIHAKFHTDASLLAREVIAGYESGLIEFSETNGDFAPEFPYLYWETSISDVLEGELDIDDLGEKQLYRVDLKIFQDESGEVAEYTWYQLENTDEDS